MAFQSENLKIENIKLIWPSIIPQLPKPIAAHLEQQLNEIFESDDDEKEGKLFTFVETWCNQKPENFKEYIAYAMIATAIELVDMPSSLFRLHASRLIAHTFNTNVDHWSHVEEMVLAVAESIWRVTTDASNINHILIAIHSYNQFTFNVSFLLLIGALGSLTTKTKSKKISLIPIDLVLHHIMKLDILKNKSDKQIMKDFLILFQSFQRWISMPSARNHSLAKILTIQSSQLDQLETYLNMVTVQLNQSIRRQMDLTENTSMVHFIQVILNNMNCITKNCRLT